MSGKVDIQSISYLPSYQLGGFPSSLLQSAFFPLCLRSMRTKAASKAMLKFKHHNGGCRGLLQAEAAEMLGLSTRTVRRMLKLNQLATIVVGRRRYISPLAIEAYLFAPSRLAQIVAEIDHIAEQMKNRHPGRIARKQLEESHA